MAILDPKFNILKITFMGIIKKGILGGFSGKVGSVVGASWKGIDYIRSLPTTVNNPRTPAQVTQRNKFSAVVNFLSKISPLLKIGFRDYANRQTAFNAAMSYNLLNAVTEESGEFEMDYSKVLVTRGKLYRPKSGEVAFMNDEITVAWDSDFSGNGSFTDSAIVLLYNTTKNEAVIENDKSERNQGVVGLTFPEYWKGDTVENFVSFISEDGKLISDSLYVGQVEIPED